MAEAARTIEGQVAPRIIKISSKRQITIPADIFAKAGFDSYAYVTWDNEEGMSIFPIDVHDQQSSVRILRSLLEQGLDGEELVDAYERIISTPPIDYKAEIAASLKEAAEGKVRPFAEMQKEIREKHGL